MKLQMFNMIQDCKIFLQSCFFPVYCVGCSSEGSYLCASCLQSVSIDLKWMYTKDRMDRRGLRNMCSLTNFRQPSVKKLIHHIKYKHQHSSQSALRELVKKMHTLYPDLFTHIDYFCPIPLHAKRKLARGFNQSMILAELLADFYQKPVKTSCIRRVQTKQQAGLSRYERIKNMQQVFEVTSKKDCQNKTIVLIDDVYTTGATLESCARSLLESGAESVYGWSFARSNL